MWCLKLANDLLPSGYIPALMNVSIAPLSGAGSGEDFPQEPSLFFRCTLQFCGALCEACPLFLPGVAGRPEVAKTALSRVSADLTSWNLSSLLVKLS